MKAKYIVSLREEVNTGNGTSKLLNVTEYANADNLPSFVEFKTVEGKTFLVNKNNIKSIVNVPTANENY